MTTSHHQSLTAVDLFCGAGGASLGVQKSGFELLAGVDHNPAALETHANNLDADHIQHDIRHVRPDILPPLKIDYVHGSTACQGYSPANTDRRLDDPRNQLVYAFIRWIDEIRPRAFTLENVAGMGTIEEGYLQNLAAEFKSLGYKVSYELLNAADYGVPQTRKRLFFVAIRNDQTMPTFGNWFPAPTHSESGGHGTEQWRPASVALEKPLVGHKGGGTGSPASWRPPEEPSHTVTGAGNHVAMTDQINENHQKEGRRPLQSLDEPSNVIRTGTAPALVQTDGGLKSDYDEIRRLSARELARLQSFPDTFEFVGNRTQTHKQIGNAVPPKLMESVAGHVGKILRGAA